MNTLAAAAAILLSACGAFVTPTARRMMTQPSLLAPVEDTAAATIASTTAAGEPMPWPLNEDAYGKFQQERDWGFAYSTTNAEGSYEVEDVEGTIPDCLTGGTFYKVGPANFERGGKRYEHVLDGDGFVAAFSFETNSRVHYTGRFVETEYYQQELAQNKVLYRNVFGTQREGGAFSNAFDIVLKNVANTNVLQWGSRLLVLWEAGRPYELDPKTLETLAAASSKSPFTELGPNDCRIRSITIDEGGPVDEMIRVGKSFTAHPNIIKNKQDGDETLLVAFTSTTNAKTDETLLEFVEYDAQWNLQQEKVEYAFADGMAPHDFSVSDHYYCFFQNRFSIDTMPYILGIKSPTQALQLMLQKPNILHLVPRHVGSGKQAMTFEIPSYFNMHTLAEATISEDGKLVLYSNGWDLTDKRYFPSNQESMPFLGSWSGSVPDFVANDGVGVVPPTMLYKTVIDLDSQTIDSHKEVVKGLVIEFPIADAADPERFVWGGASDTRYESLPNTGLCKVDLVEGKAECWWAENRCFAGEANSVAKKNGEPGSWVLTVLYDAAKKRSSLVIFDSETFPKAGPVARIHLRHHLTYGLHSSFAATSQ